MKLLKNIMFVGALMMASQVQAVDVELANAHTDNLNIQANSYSVCRLGYCPPPDPSLYDSNPGVELGDDVLGQGRVTGDTLRH